LLFGVVVCAAILAYTAARALRRADHAPRPGNVQPQHKEGSPLAARQPPPKSGATDVEPPPIEPPAVAPQSPAAAIQGLFAAKVDVEALKEEEMKVAELFAADFPDQPDALILMGRVYRNQGDSAKAAEYWEKCLALNPNRADVYSDLGWIEMQKAQYEKAAALWRKALQINPQMSEVADSLAGALICLGKPEEVVDVLERTFPADARASHRHFRLGQAYLQLRDYEKAKNNYAAALSLKPDYTNAYYGLATVYARLGQQEKAKLCREKFKKFQAGEIQAIEYRNAEYDDLLVIRRTVAKTHIVVGRLYHSRKKLQNAEALWKRAATLDSKSTGCRILLAELFQADHREPQALEMYRQLSDIEPGNAVYQLNTGVLCTLMNRFVDAEEALRKVVELAPDKPWAYHSLAQLFLKMDQKLPEAKKHAQTAVRLDPAAANYFLLAKTCDRNGDLPGALMALQRAVKLEPGNPQYRQAYEFLKQTD